MLEILVQLQLAADAEEEDEGIVAGRIISYCALDYPRMLDSVRWRLAMMKKNWQARGAAHRQLHAVACALHFFVPM